jgi:hypothetical protein
MSNARMLIGAICAGVAALAVTGETQAAEFFGVRYNGQLVRLDTTAQTVTGLGSIFVGPQTPTQFEDLDFDGAGNLYAMRGFADGNFPPTNFNQAYRVLNTATGQSLLTASFDDATARRYGNIAWRSSTGQFYGNRNNDGRIGVVGVTTGSFAPVTGVFNGVRTYMDGLAVNPATGNAYGLVDMGLSIFGEINYSLASVDLDTGLASVIGSFGQNGSTFRSLRFDGDGVLYTTNYATGDVYTVNVGTGAASLLFAGGAGATQITGLAFIVPSPAGAGVLVMGASVLAVRRRRSRR